MFLNCDIITLIENDGLINWQKDFKECMYHMQRETPRSGPVTRIVLYE